MTIPDHTQKQSSPPHPATRPFDLAAAMASDGSQIDLGVLGMYRVKSLIGKGGMGAVFRAEHTALGRTVALKVILHDRHSEETKIRFLREARTMESLKNAHTAEVYDVGESNGIYFISMQLLEGSNFDEYLTTHSDLTFVEKVEFAIGIATSLRLAHDLGVVHRDLKPSNVWIEPNGNVRLLDFGLSKNVHDDQATGLTMHGQTLGTPAFMAPEQVLGKAATERTDLYSFGVILYFLFAGHRPHTATRATELMTQIATVDAPALLTKAPDVPRPLAILIDRMLCREPADRPTGMAEVQAILDGFGASPLRKTHLRRIRAISLAAIVGVAALSYFGLKWSRMRTEPTSLSTTSDRPPTEPTRVNKTSATTPIVQPTVSVDRDGLMRLNGTNSRIEIPKQMFKYSGEFDFTVEFRIQFTELGGMREILCNMNADGGMSVAITPAKRLRIGFHAKSLSPCLSKTEFVTGQFYHCAVTYRRSNQEAGIFVDGKKETVTSIGRYRATPWPFQIGADPNNGSKYVNCLQAELDDFRISNVVRYTDDYDATRPFEEDERTILHYQFRENNGPVVLDSTSNKRHGIQHNCVWRAVSKSEQGP